MFKIHLKLTIFMFCTFFVILATAVWAEDYQFKGYLDCSKIGPRHPIQTEATGEVFLQLDESKQELTYKLSVEKIKDVYMAHLHFVPGRNQDQREQWPIGQDPMDHQGQLAVWLYPSTDYDAPDRCIKGEFSGILAQGVIRPEDLVNDITFSDFIEALRNGNIYVNVHTRKYVSGEICGLITTQEM